MNNAEIITEYTETRYAASLSFTIAGTQEIVKIRLDKHNQQVNVIYDAHHSLDLETASVISQLYQAAIKRAKEGFLLKDSKPVTDEYQAAMTECENTITIKTEQSEISIYKQGGETIQVTYQSNADPQLESLLGYAKQFSQM